MGMELGNTRLFTGGLTKPTESFGGAILRGGRFGRGDFGGLLRGGGSGYPCVGDRRGDLAATESLEAGNGLLEVFWVPIFCNGSFWEGTGLDDLAEIAS